MNAITTQDVKYVASLAKIAITEDEATRFTKELDTILGYVQQLSAVDTTGLAPTYQVTGLKNVTRADEVIDYAAPRDVLLKNAPHIHEGYVKVPKVL